MLTRCAAGSAAKSGQKRHHGSQGEKPLALTPEFEPYRTGIRDPMTNNKLSNLCECEDEADWVVWFRCPGETLNVLPLCDVCKREFCIGVQYESAIIPHVSGRCLPMRG